MRMKYHHIRIFLTGLLIILFTPAYASDYPGLPTRSQNPLLQGYFIPAMPLTSNAGWSFSHALYITNTYHLDQNPAEQVIIDVENKRYDFQTSYSQELWHFNLNISLIDNRAGFLDNTIENWHDFFGLPQGGRDQAAPDQLQLFYQKDGQTVFDSQQPDQGLPDIQLALGYQLNNYSQLWMGIELPSGSSYDFISNDAADFALWLSSSAEINPKINTYGSLGVALPSDGGVFKHRLNDQFLFAQAGMTYAFTDDYVLLLQADYHSPIVNDSELDTLDHSLQAQFALRLPSLIDNHQLELFFSEDVFPGHAPDISFSIRLSTVEF